MTYYYCPHCYHEGYGLFKYKIDGFVFTATGIYAVCFTISCPVCNKRIETDLKAFNDQLVAIS